MEKRCRTDESEGGGQETGCEVSILDDAEVMVSCTGDLHGFLATPHLLDHQDPSRDFWKGKVKDQHAALERGHVEVKPKSAGDALGALSRAGTSIGNVPAH